MRKPFIHFLWVTLLMSVGAAVINTLSFLTEYWIVSSAVSDNQNKFVSEINYGLMYGTIKRRLEVSTETEYRLYIACSLGNNVCAWSCLDDETERNKEIEELYDTGAVTFSCRRVNSKYSSGSGSQIQLVDNSTTLALEQLHNWFINATIWLGTIIFLAVSGILCLIAALITGYNLYFIPYKTFLTVQGLYIWHGIAALTALFTLLLWGSAFLMTLKNNVATVDTIMGTLSSEGRASLGFSYWLNLLPLLLEVGCIGLLYCRQKLFEDKPHDTIPIEVQSSISHLY